MIVKWQAKYWLKRKFKKDVAIFFENIKEYEDFYYLKALLKFQSAPTMFVKKTGSLINVCSKERDLLPLYERKREYFEKNLGLKSIILRKNNDGFLLYLYEERLLKKRLQRKDVIKFLEKKGYSLEMPLESVLENLKENFQNNMTCPCEVGIFLGYPTDDVIAFANNRKDAKCVGYWKCYNRKNISKLKFFCYDMSKWVVTKLTLQTN